MKKFFLATLLTIMFVPLADAQTFHITNQPASTFDITPQQVVQPPQCQTCGYDCQCGPFCCCDDSKSSQTASACRGGKQRNEASSGVTPVDSTTYYSLFQPAPAAPVVTYYQHQQPVTYLQPVRQPVAVNTPQPSWRPAPPAYHAPRPVQQPAPQWRPVQQPTYYQPQPQYQQPTTYRIQQPAYAPVRAVARRGGC